LIKIYIEFLNENSGAIQAIATTVLIIVTSLLVTATIKLVKVTQALSKPLLYFYFKSDDRAFTTSSGPLTPPLHVKNVGNGPATEINFKIEQIKISPLDALAPQEERNINNILPSTPTNEIKITNIKYNDITKQSHSQNNVTIPRPDENITTFEL